MSVGAPWVFKRQQGRVQGPDAMRFIALTGFSWWEALYEDGRTIGEWDSLLDDRRRIKVPDRKQVSGSRWEEIEHKNLRGLRLIGPTGEVADLRATRDHTLFQFKIGVAQLVGPDFARTSGDHRQAHVIGVIADKPREKLPDLSEVGTCVCVAWEHDDEQGNRLPPPGRMVGPFVDNVLRFAFHKVGPLALENLGLKL
jgi:hypothetical protein